MKLKDIAIGNGLGWFSLLCCLLIVVILEIRRPKIDPQRDSCVSCHINVSNPNTSHDLKTLGCSVCHLGNGFAYEKDAAHVGYVKNPSDLSVVEFTCGRTGCHTEMPSKVKNSVMATNSGMLRRLQELWINMGNKSNKWPEDILELKRQAGYFDGILDYFRKMCGGCHLWRRIGDVEGEMGQKGGGCSGCHVIRTKKVKDIGTKESYQHPIITMIVPPENCMKCHNRSARIATSYKGMVEVLGIKKVLNEKEGTDFFEYGGRIYLQLLPDIHHRKAGLWCIDCHNGQELMGDGQRNKEMNTQLDCSCQMCHGPIEELKIRPTNELGKKLISLNKRLTESTENILYSPKDYPLYHIRYGNGRLVLFRKSDGFPFEISFSKKVPYHDLKGHERLSCSACHSSWMPQCFGCHIGKEEGLQWDWVLEKGSRGRWFEKVDFIRYRDPPLGVRENKIYPMFSHPVYFYQEKKEALHVALTLPSFDPHTTQREARTCASCHIDAKAVGLKGIFLDENIQEHLFEKVQGKKRGFKEDEWIRISLVGQCMACHKDYEDLIFKDFQKSYKRFLDETNLPCKRIINSSGTKQPLP